MFATRRILRTTSKTSLPAANPALSHPNSFTSCAFSAMEYAGIDTPAACYADFCLIPVRTDRAHAQ